MRISLDSPCSNSHSPIPSSSRKLHEISDSGSDDNNEPNVSNLLKKRAFESSSDEDEIKTIRKTYINASFNDNFDHDNSMEQQKDSSEAKPKKKVQKMSTAFTDSGEEVLENPFIESEEIQNVEENVSQTNYELPSASTSRSHESENSENTSNPIFSQIQNFSANTNESAGPSANKQGKETKSKYSKDLKEKLRQIVARDPVFGGGKKRGAKKKLEPKISKNNLTKNVALNNSDDENDENVDNANHEKKKRKSKERKYSPKPGSGGYAILLGKYGFT